MERNDRYAKPDLVILGLGAVSLMLGLGALGVIVALMRSLGGFRAALAVMRSLF